MNSSIKKGGGAAGEDGQVMVKPQKFMFDMNDFDRKKSALASMTDAEYEAVKADSFAQGRQAGIAETLASQDQQGLDCLNKIAASLDVLLAAERQRDIDFDIDAAQLALKIMAKLLPTLAAKVALDEVTALITQSFDDRSGEPRIVIVVHDSLLAKLKEKISLLAADRGYAGKVILLAEETMPVANCRVEWADGGVERVFDRMFMTIENEVTKAVTALKETVPAAKKSTPETIRKETT